MKKQLALLLFLLLTAQLPAQESDSIQAACDRYRLENSQIRITSPQSFIAQINLQQTLHEVNKLNLQAKRQRNRMLLATIGGGLLLLTMALWSARNIRRKIRILRLSQEGLEKARQEAEQSIRNKNLFLSNMSHEIRTPLNALAGFSAILTERGIDNETRQQCNDIIRQNSDLLIKLIDDVVDLSSLELGAMQFTLRTKEVVSLCHKVTDTVACIKQTAATVRFDSSLGTLFLHTDEARLQQLLINLLINATKFTPEGEIVLALTTEGDMALFSVTDTGCGIAPEQRDKVFRRFEKLDEGAQGSGLGLSICRLIVEQLGGTLWIDPDYTGGTRFCFTHPLPRAEQPASQGKEGEA